MAMPVEHDSRCTGCGRYGLGEGKCGVYNCKGKKRLLSDPPLGPIAPKPKLDVESAEAG